MKLYIDENNKVVTMHEATSDMKCFEEFENRKPKIVFILFMSY